VPDTYVRKPIGEYLNKIRKEGQAYYEPFVGGGWILSQIKDELIIQKLLLCIMFVQK
jgi:site-specific DNA-adenine methylase